ncbi:MAG: DUF4345 family protein [Pseudomonadota bacterium]
MVWVYRALIAAFALLFFTMGIGFYFEPVGSGGDFGLEAMSPAGMNSLRGDIGGLFVASAVLLLWGLIASNPHLLRAVAVLMLAIALGRGIGFAFDPVAQESVIALVVEIVTAAVLLRASMVPPWSSAPELR